MLYIIDMHAGKTMGKERKSGKKKKKGKNRF